MQNKFMKHPTNKIIKVETTPLTPLLKPQSSGVFIKTLNVFLIPAKNRYQKFYHPTNNFWLTHLLADVFLLLIIIGLIGLNIFLLTHPTKNTLQSYFDQSVLAIKQQPHLTIELVKDRDIIKTGVPFTYSINYKNDGSATATKVMMVLDLESELPGLNKKIVLDETKYPELKAIAAGKTGTIKYQVNLNTKVEQPTNPNNYIVQTSLTTTYQDSKNATLELMTTSQQLTQKISTNLTITAVAKYRLTEGDQLGVGPLPPTFGQTTKYWIFIAAETDYNDANDIVVTASLPANVRPTGRISATSPQPIKFNAENNQVTWEINRLIAPSINYPQIGTAFEVELTPTQGQIGQTADLLQDIRASGRDQFTGETMNFILQNLSSKITEDLSGGKIR